MKEKISTSNQALHLVVVGDGLVEELCILSVILRLEVWVLIVNDID
jgi:hypothetical protein